MARYAAFFGRRVEVHYRAGDIVLPACGRLVADSGRSIFLEERFELRGQSKHFRWEIPYQCIVRIEERPPEPRDRQPVPAPAAAKSAKAAAADSPLLPLRNRPKEA